MPTIIRREPIICPTCQLRLTVLLTDDGATIEYDIADWTRLCQHPGISSPLVCPALQALVKPWVGRS